MAAVREALAAIPREHRTPAVENLMADAEQLGSPEWARELVALVAAWFGREPRKMYTPAREPK